MKRLLYPIHFVRSKKSQMHVVMAIMLIAILLATTVFFWRTSENFSKSYSQNIDEKSFQNIATYIENVVAHNEIAWIERTLVQTNMTIPMKYDGANYVGENELFKVTYINPNSVTVTTKDKNGVDVDNDIVLLNTRFYVDGSYNIYSNPTIPTLKDKNIIGDFYVYKIEPKVSGWGQEYIVHLTPMFKSAVIGDAGQPPESLAKVCFLLEYPETYWSLYYDSKNNTYSVYPSNYFIINAKDYGVDERYINYYTNIFIPSKSNMIDYLALAPTKDILSNYIKSGGSLIMLSQYPEEKTKYNFLPINIIFDKGQYDTIGVSKQHNITNNIDPYEVAGSYFSAEGTILEPYFDSPVDEILLREAQYGEYENSNPSLIISTWGTGKVITTTVPIEMHSLLDSTFSVCEWWDPDTFGNAPDWHFRKHLEVDPVNVTRVNEPIEVIINPTADINKFAKQGFLDLESTTLDYDSIRVIELIDNNCSGKREVPSQTYPFTPNMQGAGYKNAPLEFHEHTIFFELDTPIDIRLEMEIPAGSDYKDNDDYSIETDFKIFVNGVAVTEIIQEGGSTAPGYWDPYNGGATAGGGPEDRYSCVLPAKYFQKGDNRIRLSMENPDSKRYTWYQNVLFRLYEKKSTGNFLFYREYPPIYVYFSMGASPDNTVNSKTVSGQKRYYDIYFDIEENGKKSVPLYRVQNNTVSLDWSLAAIDSPTIFSASSEGGLTADYFPILMNNSSPSTGDVDNSSIIDVVIGMRNGDVRAIKGTDGSTIWQNKVVNLIGEYRSGTTVYLHAPVAISSPAICDMNKDGLLEIVNGGGNLLAVFPRTGSSRTITISTDACTVSVMDAATGTILWTFPVDGAMLSAPAIADIDNDGYEDIIVEDTYFNNLQYRHNQSSLLNTNITIKNNIYAFSGRTHGIIFKKTGVQQTLPPSYFAYRNSRTPYIMIPSNSPAVADIDNDGQMDIIWTSVDGNVYVIKYSGGVWNNQTLTSFSVPSITPSSPLGYIVSSPVIVHSNYQENHEDILVSVIVRESSSSNLVKLYNVDGSTGVPTELIAESNSNELISGHPVSHTPHGYSLRGPIMAVPAGQYLLVEHLDLTHRIRGRLTQTTSTTSSYATPAIAEVNNYSTYQKRNDSFFFDCIVGAENGKLYALAYRDTTAGDDTNNETASPPGSDNDKLHRLWEYTPPNPATQIRGSVAIDDIDNDGRSEIIFMTHDGRVFSLKVWYNYTRWNYSRHNIRGTANTQTKVNPVSYEFSEPEAVEFGNVSDPYDDKFRLLSRFALGASNEYETYISEDWIMIDSNKNIRFSDEIPLSEDDITKIYMKTYEGKPIERSFGIESIYGDVVNNDFIITFFDRGMVKLFNNIMAYTSAPTKNIQIEEGIWVNLDIPNTLGKRQYVIQGLGDTIRIYDPQHPDVSYTHELKGTSVYGTISSSSKNKYVVITSYGAYLSPNPQEG